MLDGKTYATIVHRVTSTLTILETVAKPYLMCAMVQSGCPAEEAGPILESLIRMDVIRNVGAQQVTLGYKGRGVVEKAQEWETQNKTV
jgi:hypothetical protein